MRCVDRQRPAGLWVQRSSTCRTANGRFRRLRSLRRGDTPRSARWPVAHRADVFRQLRLPPATRPMRVEGVALNRRCRSARTSCGSHCASCRSPSPRSHAFPEVLHLDLSEHELHRALRQAPRACPVLRALAVRHHEGRVWAHRALHRESLRTVNRRVSAAAAGAPGASGRFPPARHVALAGHYRGRVPLGAAREA